MSTSDNEKYAWFDPWVEEERYGDIALTLAKINSAEEFLAMAGAQLLPGTLHGVSAVALGYTSDHVLVGAMPVPGKPGWVLGVESHSCAGFEKAGGLSVPGGMAVAFYCNETSGHWFIWAEGGVTVAEYRFETCVPIVDAIDGSDPQRLVVLMRKAGLDPEDRTHPCAAAAALVEVITGEGDTPGVVITEDLLEKGEFTVGAVPLLRTDSA
jgi:hypothetical protein